MKAYALKGPDGQLHPAYTKDNPRFVENAAEESFIIDWDVMYSAGWRVVKVEIKEIE